MVSLRTDIAGIELESPLILASGILDENGYSIRRILEEGAAAAVTKSIGVVERIGYSPPVVAESGDSLINAIGLANPGIDAFREEMDIAGKVGKPVIGSIFGSSVDEFLLLGKKMEEYGASAVELNLSCPHVEGVGSEVGDDPELVESIVNELKSHLKIPVMAKLPPNVTDILEIAKAASAADALVLINTVRAMKIDIYARMPVLSHKTGGLSGPAVKPIGVRCVYEVFRETNKEIVGVGGISTAEDAIEYIMAGSRAVQLGTILSTLGRAAFAKVNEGISSFMKDEHFSSISEMVGAAVA